MEETSGQPAVLPEDAQPFGPMDPNAAGTLANAGAQGRRISCGVGKGVELASLLTVESVGIVQTSTSTPGAR